MQYIGFGKDTIGGAGGQIVEVTSLADSGPGTLRNALEQATTPTEVRFAVTGDINLGEEILVPKDVTVDGAYRVTIANKGLVSPWRNNIFERLLFRDTVGPGDGIRVGDFGQPPAHDIVVNRCHFYNPSYYDLSPEPDECISAIFGAHNITISWCSFVHVAKVFLFGNGDVGPEIDGQITVTLHHNYFHRCGRRIPFLRYGKVDMFNNHIDCWDLYTMKDGPSMSAGVKCTENGEILLENNLIHQDKFFKRGWLTALLYDSGYHKGAFTESGGKIQSIGNEKNHWWIQVEDNGPVFERPYPAEIDSVDDLDVTIWNGIPEQVWTYCVEE